MYVKLFNILFKYVIFKKLELYYILYICINNNIYYINGVELGVFIIFI